MPFASASWTTRLGWGMPRSTTRPATRPGARSSASTSRMFTVSEETSPTAVKKATLTSIEPEAAGSGRVAHQGDFSLGTGSASMIVPPIGSLPTAGGRARGEGAVGREAAQAFPAQTHFQPSAGGRVVHLQGRGELAAAGGDLARADAQLGRKVEVRGRRVALPRENGAEDERPR